jgi:hypothetical protein
MTGILSKLTRRLTGLLRNEDGSSTVEFVIVLPAFLMIFLSAFESGMMMVRNVMLERAVDMSVRELRLGGATVPDFDQLKGLICFYSVVIADCDQVIQIELEPIDTLGWDLNRGDARCIDQSTTINPVDETIYAVGQNNDLMLVRVCALFKPMFPSTPLGMEMPDDGNGNYALVATTAFVNEPSR